MSYKPIDPKRDEIRRYLERGSVLDALTKVMVRVIKERPENPMEYIRNNIGVVRHQHDKYERLSQDLQVANEEIQRLRAIINKINPDVLQVAGGVAEEVEKVAVSLPPQETAVETAQVPEVIEVVDTAEAQVEQELAAAVEECHIEETIVATESKPDSANQSSTVQAETSSANQTE
ncbi:CG17202 [Drosophila busckii]|uniref:CG17202 n=1 Tax=Drosophila busckii TaxID=30019 RepID=A0A0M4EU64_DROBS|nr:CG17202 [Drosophila busckii]